MKINEMQLYSAINEFIDREIMPMGASLDWKKQLVHEIKVGVVKYQSQNLIKKYLNSDALKMLEIVDGDGNVDIEPIYISTINALSNGKQIEIAGIIFKESDVKNLYSTLQRHAN